MNFGERLQDARKCRGWSQWDLAGKMGVLLKDDEGVDAWRNLYKSATGYTVGDDMVLSWRQEKLARYDRFVRSIE